MDKRIYLICTYATIGLVMAAFNIVESALPYFTKDTEMYNYVTISLSLIYFTLAFSNMLASYLTTKLSLNILIAIGKHTVYMVKYYVGGN